MTNANKPHVHAEVIKAWADGAEIEYRNTSNDMWRDILGNSPAWHSYVQYRAKPQPVFKYHGIMKGFENQGFHDFNHTTGYHSCASYVRSAESDKWKVIAIVKTTFVEGVPVAIELLK